MAQFVYLPVSLFVHTCQRRSRERNECLRAIRPVGEEEEGGGKKVGEGEWLRESVSVWTTPGSGQAHNKKRRKRKKKNHSQGAAQEE